MRNYLKFWGTRGSCSVSGANYKHFGGNTCCLEIKHGDTILILDAGTGIRPLGFTMVDDHPIRIELFLSHMHWDHLIGFPYFEPICRPGTHITIWSPAGAGRSCRELFNQLLATEFFPIRLDQVQAQLDFRTTQQKTPVQIDGITIDFHTTQHPGLTHCFKIKTPHQTIGYITDNEMLFGFHGHLSEIEEKLFEPYESLIHFMKGCDLLVHEAQYTPDEYLHKVGWGHSSARNAVAFIERTRPKEWLVTHHDPQHSDEDLRKLSEYTKKLLQEQKISTPVHWIEDGFTYELR